jgi:hypothetical protein
VVEYNASKRLRYVTPVQHSRPISLCAEEEDPDPNSGLQYYNHQWHPLRRPRPIYRVSEEVHEVKAILDMEGPIEERYRIRSERRKDISRRRAAVDVCNLWLEVQLKERKKAYV